MKYLIFLTLLLSGEVLSQDFISQVKDLKQIDIQYSNATINIIGHDESSIIIRRLGAPIAKDERSEGLNAVSEHSDNTGLGFFVESSEDKIQVYRQDVGRATFEIMIPAQSALNINELRWHGGSISVKDIKGEVHIESKNSDIQLNNIGKASFARSTSGNITASGVQSPLDYKSISGVVTVNLGKGVAADLHLKTISGFIKTDLHVKNTKQHKGTTMSQVGHVRKVEYKLNGGGELVKVQTISGIVKLKTGN